MKTIRPATSYQRRAAASAERLLRDALHLARVAQCPRLIQRIQRAVTSAGGAVRHVNHRAKRTDPAGHALDTRGQPYGTTTITAGDRAAFAHVESPAVPRDLPAPSAPSVSTQRRRAPWYRVGQFA